MEKMKTTEAEGLLPTKRKDADNTQKIESDAKRRAKREQFNESDSDDDSETSAQGSGSHGKSCTIASKSSVVNDNMDVDRMRKEKRLAMNRESARLRRKRKKQLIHSLENKVDELSTKLKEFQTSNERLTTKLAEVEGELKAANAKLLQHLMTRSSPTSLDRTTSGGLSIAGVGIESLNQLRSLPFIDMQQGLDTSLAATTAMLDGNRRTGVGYATGISNEQLLHAQFAAAVTGPTNTDRRLVERASLNEELMRQLLDANSSTGFPRGNLMRASYSLSASGQQHQFGGASVVSRRSGIHPESFDNAFVGNQLFDNESIRRLSATGNNTIHHMTQQGQNRYTLGADSLNQSQNPSVGGASDMGLLQNLLAQQRAKNAGFSLPPGANYQKGASNH